MWTTRGAQNQYRDRESDAGGVRASAFLVREVGQRSSLICRGVRLTDPSPKGYDVSHAPLAPDVAASSSSDIGTLHFSIIWLDIRIQSEEVCGIHTGLNVHQSRQVAAKALTYPLL